MTPDSMGFSFLAFMGYEFSQTRKNILWQQQDRNKTAAKVDKHIRYLLGRVMHELGSALVDGLQRLEVGVQPLSAPMLHQLSQHHLHYNHTSV